MKRLPFVCLALSLACAPGCAFWKKSEKKKESSAIAGEVEESFKRRWIEKRAAELVTQGESAEYARGQAVREFGEKYEFNGPKK